MQLSQSVPKTAVGRFRIFLLMVGATLTGSFLLLFLVINTESDTLIDFAIVFFGLPLVVLGTLLFLLGREKRRSNARPGLKEFFLAGVGAIFPFAFLTAVMWVAWWIIYGIAYGIAFLFGFSEPYGAPFVTASVIVSLIALGTSFILVRVNWRNTVDQLYPIVGNTSAFAKLSQTSKMWLFKRGLIMVGLFLVSVIIILFVAPLSEGDAITINDRFWMTLLLFVIQLFLVSISAWLWLCKPPVPQGLEVATEVLAKMLTEMGYQVTPLRDMINQPERQGEIDSAFVASVDLVAQKDGRSMVIDILTPVETPRPPEWGEAAEFKTAVWYLSDQLNLPPPVEARFILVDVTPAESLLAFTQAHDIQIHNTTNDALIDTLVSDATLQQTATSWFASPVPAGGQS